ncbi:MAG TPA: ATP-dependent zinc protease [Gammaproteobacteria bacterium]|nr:ATP-dependent zinc protease [Gammaproteobacteria bacterium]
MSGDRPVAVGWREWVAFPELGLPYLKAKMDTGARTSALHAFELEPFDRGDSEWIRFAVHPLQRRTDLIVWHEAEVADVRMVSDSGGHKERRYVIRTDLALGGRRWAIECTLTNRDTMLFRVLLGRTALAGRVLVDPENSYLTGRPRRPSRAYTPHTKTTTEGERP